jgi:hypothetical protein
MSISSTANVCPGLAAGTRLPYPVVVRVVKEKNRSWEKLPSPWDPNRGPAWSTPSAR